MVSTSFFHEERTSSILVIAKWVSVVGLRILCKRILGVFESPFTLDEEWSSGKAALLGSRSRRFNSSFLRMVLIMLLELGTAIALISISRVNGIHYALSGQAGLLALSVLVLSPVNFSSLALGKLVVYGNMSANGSVIIGELTLGVVGLLAFAVCCIKETVHTKVQGTFALANVAIIIAGIALIAAQNPVVVVSALELQSYAAYTLVALGSYKTYLSATALVYFIVGATATACILVGWGMSNGLGNLSAFFQPALASTGESAQIAGLGMKIGGYPYSF